MVLTKRQKEVFDFITSYINDHGVAPSFDEIAEQFNFSSKGTVYRHIHTLEKKGLIITNKNKSRSIRLNSENAILHELPVIGTLSRRNGIRRFKIPDYVRIPGHFGCSGNDFLYLVEDSSFRDEYILKRDFVLLSEIPNGEEGPLYCLVQVDNKEYMIKKYHIEKDIVKLFSVNSDLLPLFYEPARIKMLGKVLGIIREF